MAHAPLATALVPSGGSPRARRALPLSFLLHAAVAALAVAASTLGGTELPPVPSPVADVILRWPQPPAATPVAVAVPVRRPCCQSLRHASLPSALAPPAPTAALAPSSAPAPDVFGDADRACAGCVIGDPTADASIGGDGDGTAATGPRADGARDPVPVGGRLRAPAKLRHVAPQYPALAQRAGVQGTVVIECVIDPQGRVVRARVVRSIALLDAAALAAVQQWVYAPSLLNGVPVPVVMTVSVRFHFVR
jgi:protein TonB